MDKERGKARLVPAGRWSPDKAPVVESTFTARFATLALGKCVPEAERLVPSARDDRLAVGTHREVEHAAGVARERNDHVQRRILPNAYLVLRRRRGETVCGDDLMRRERPCEVANLYVRVGHVSGGKSKSDKADAPGCQCPAR